MRRILLKHEEPPGERAGPARWDCSNGICHLGPLPGHWEVEFLDVPCGEGFFILHSLKSTISGFESAIE